MFVLHIKTPTHGDIHKQLDFIISVQKLKSVETEIEKLNG